MSAVDLRPLSLGELLDRLFQYYRRNFLLFAGIMLFPQLFLLFKDLGIDFIQRTSRGSAGSHNAAASIGSATVVFGLVVFLAAIGYFIAHAAAEGATTFALSDLYMGGSSNIRAAYRRLRGNLGALIGLLFSIGLRVMGCLLGAGLLIAIMPAGLRYGALGTLLLVLIVASAAVVLIHLVLRYSLAIPVLLLEGKGIGDSIRRSGVLTKGYKWRLFLIAFLTVLVAVVLSLSVSVPSALLALLVRGHQAIAPVWIAYPTYLFSAIAQAISAPLLSIGLVLAYYDSRVRTEALDLELMMSSLGSAAGVPQPGVNFRLL
jgi:uncharacterized membrane protein